jgi:hypothetical protein
MFEAARCPACDQPLPTIFFGDLHACPHCNAAIRRFNRDHPPWSTLIGFVVLASAPASFCILVNFLALDLLAYPLAGFAFIFSPLILDYLQHPYTNGYELKPSACSKCGQSFGCPAPLACPSCKHPVPPPRPSILNQLRGGPQPGRRHMMIAAGLIIAMIVIAFSLPKSLEARASANWPSVPGTVVEVHFAREPVDRKDPPPEFRYRYTVNGVTYEGQRLELLNDLTKYNAPKYLDSYKKDSPVTVYYSPRNPARAVLIPGLQPDQRGFLCAALAGLAMLPSLAFLVLLDLYRFRKTTPTPLGAIALDWQPAPATIPPMKLVCPSCGIPIPAEDTNVDTGLAKCRGCNEVINIFQTLGLPNPAAAAPAEEPAPCPANVQVEDLGPLSWTARWRWFTPALFFQLIFCVVWDGFLVFWYSAAFASRQVCPAAFATGHLAVGVGFTYNVIAGFLNTTRVTLDPATLTIRHSPVYWRGNRQIPSTSIRQLTCKRVPSQRKGAPDNFELHVTTAAGESFRLLSLPTLDHARFLRQQLERRLDIAPHPGEVS